MTDPERDYGKCGFTVCLPGLLDSGVIGPIKLTLEISRVIPGRLE